MSNDKKKMSPVIIILIVIISIPILLFLCGIIAAIAIPQFIKYQEKAENNSSYEINREEYTIEDIAQNAVNEIEEYYEIYSLYPKQIEDIKSLNNTNIKISISSTDYAPFFAPELSNGFYYFNSVKGDTFQLVIYDNEGERLKEFTNVDYIVY